MRPPGQQRRPSRSGRRAAFRSVVNWKRGAQLWFSLRVSWLTTRNMIQVATVLRVRVRRDDSRASRTRKP